LGNWLLTRVSLIQAELCTCAKASFERMPIAQGVEPANRSAHLR